MDVVGFLSGQPGLGQQWADHKYQREAITRRREHEALTFGEAKKEATRRDRQDSMKELISDVSFVLPAIMDENSKSHGDLRLLRPVLLRHRDALGEDIQIRPLDENAKGMDRRFNIIATDPKSGNVLFEQEVDARGGLNQFMGTLDPNDQVSMFAEQKKRLRSQNIFRTAAKMTDDQLKNIMPDDTAHLPFAQKQRYLKLHGYNDEHIKKLLSIPDRFTPVNDGKTIIMDNEPYELVRDSRTNQLMFQKTKITKEQATELQKPTDEQIRKSQERLHERAEKFNTAAEKDPLDENGSEKGKVNQEGVGEYKRIAKAIGGDNKYPDEIADRTEAILMVARTRAQEELGQLKDFEKISPQEQRQLLEEKRKKLVDELVAAQTGKAESGERAKVTPETVKQNASSYREAKSKEEKLKLASSWSPEMRTAVHSAINEKKTALASEESASKFTYPDGGVVGQGRRGLSGEFKFGKNAIIGEKTKPGYSNPAYTPAEEEGIAGMFSLQRR